MILNVAPNKISIQPQVLNLTNINIATLVGKNGAGKSKILEKIFEDLLIDPEVTLISYTSGQNESFSNIFSRHLSGSRRRLIEQYMKDVYDDDGKIIEDRAIGLNTFHFNPSWIRFLIFFATTLKPTGYLRTFLLEKDYITVSDDGLNDDATTNLYFRFRILTWYVRRIEEADRKEAEDYNYKSIRKSIMHDLLEKVATHFENDFDFSNPTYFKWRTLFAKDALKVLGKDTKSIFTFLLYALEYDSFIERSTVGIYFKNGIELNEMSDGEFQLMTIYALIDLFDSEKTLFLFDEIDSHVHYTNNNKLWSFLKSIKGKLITSTHSADSIIKNDYDSIKYVEGGKIIDSLILRELAARLSDVVGITQYEFTLARRIKFIALIDDEVDWIIFKKLANKKIDNSVDEVLEQIICIKRSSSFKDNNEIFGKGKLLFVEEFKDQLRDQQKETKKFILISDRDKLSKGSIDPDSLQVKIHDTYSHLKKFNGIETKLFSWKRVEIENYLLSYSMLEKVGKLKDLKAMFPHIIFTEGSNFDNIADIEECEAKPFVHPLYKAGGFNETQLDELIALIPVEEISEDIVIMYNSIKKELA